MVLRYLFNASLSAFGEQRRGGTRGAPQVTFGPGSGETIRDRHERRSSVHAAAIGGGLSRWRLPADGFVAGEASRAERFDVRSSAPADTGGNQSRISKSR